MELFKYLNEKVLIGKDRETEKFFNIALKQAFSSDFVGNIEGKLRKRLKIIKRFLGAGIEAATASKSAIIINPEVFNRLPAKKQIGVLLHEFIHVLQLSKRFFIFKQFKELDLLTSRLYRIVKSSIVKPFNFKMFLNRHREGKGLGPGGKLEIIAYLMNDRIRWKAITQQGRREFLLALKQSGLFNLNHTFWKQRIRRMKI